MSLIASKCWKFKNEVGLYRDDGLASLRASSPIWARLTRTRERGAALGTNLIPLKTKLVTQTKRVPAWPVINQLCFPERHFSANGISLRLSEVQMKFYERSLQALLSTLAASPLARAFSRDSLRSPKYPNRRACSQAMVSQSARPLRKKLKKTNKQTNKKSAKCSNRMALKSLMWSNLTNGSYKPYMNLA